jgi:phenylalanyl-tRNA synthetase beta chain
VGDILSEIRAAGGDLLETVELFDLYRGKQITAGKKSLAFSMTFRSDRRSLESKEVIGIQSKIAQHLKKRFNAEIREG